MHQKRSKGELLRTVGIQVFLEISFDRVSEQGGLIESDIRNSRPREKKTFVFFRQRWWGA